MDWSALPVELVDLISGLLPTVRDYFRFRAVCVSWRTATAAAAAARHFPGQLPWLMMGSREASDWCNFFSLSHNQIHRLHLPELREKYVCGSSHGWVAAIDKTSQAIFLLNPLTRDQIHLPPLDATFLQGNTDDKQDFPVYIYIKVVLSSNPTSPGGCVAVAMSTDTPEIRICRAGGEDESWTLLDCTPSASGGPDLWGPCEDAVFFEGKLYLVDDVGRIIVCDNFDPAKNPRAMFVTSPSPSSSLAEYPYCTEHPRYLVPLFGKLLFAHISCHGDEMVVFEFHPSEDRWVEMQSLGDGVLFIGKNAAFSLFAKGGGIRGNCIFVADEICDVYDFEEGIFKQLPCYPVPGPSRLNPIWFMPSLC